MCEAELYLRNPANPSSLYVKIGGKRRRIFFIEYSNVFGIVAEGKRKSGPVFTAWDSIEKIYYPVAAERKQRKLIMKFQRLADKATFTNPFIRTIKNADLSKSLIDNNISTGGKNEGEVISLEAIRKWCGEANYRAFKTAIQSKSDFKSGRFEFRGYDGSLSVSVYKEGETYLQPGEITAQFSKEYRGCGNGYYYLLINDNNFIGYDID